MSILITGGAGFIGTHLAQELASVYPSREIVLLDLPGTFNKKHASFSKIEADIRVASQLEPLKKRSFDAVVHLAAQASGYLSHRFPALYMDTNLKGTVHVMEALRKSGMTSFVFASSMSVYAEGQAPLKEDDVLQPKSIYGFTKLAGEQYVELKCKEWGIPYTSLRFFNVYGPGQNYNNLNQGMASIYLAHLMKYGEVRVKGSLARFRDFVYVKDVVKAIQLVLNAPQNEAYNVGTGVKTTVDSLIHQLCNLVKPHRSLQENPIRLLGTHEGDMFGTVADSRKLQKLGWKPDVSLNQGLPLMVKDIVELWRS